MDFAGHLEWAQYKTMVEVVYYLIYIIGLPWAVIEALRKQRKIVDAEEERRYLEVNNQYIDFLKLSLQFPHLHVSDFSPRDEGVDLKPDEKIQQNILFDMLTSIFERTYLMYDVETKGGGVEWGTWEKWIEGYVTKANYRKYIEAYVEDGCFAHTFQNFMLRKYKEAKL